MNTWRLRDQALHWAKSEPASLGCDKELCQEVLCPFCGPLGGHHLFFMPSAGHNFCQLAPSVSRAHLSYSPYLFLASVSPLSARVG